MTKCRVLQSGEALITQPYHLFVPPWKAAHWGIDLVRYPHYLDWIVAHSAGIVVSVVTWYKGTVWDGSWGNLVKIKHKNGFCTLYAHLAYGTIKVKEGDKVKKGQVLGYMGSTGPSTAGHLHWEVYNKSGVRIDPAPYLDADLPGMNTKSVTAKGYDLTKTKWLPEVKNTNIAVQTIGNPYHRLGAVTLKVENIKGFEGYNVWRRGKKTFGKKITGYGTDHGEYAGSKYRGTVAIAIDCPHIAYRAKIKKTQTWLPTVYGKHYNLKDPDKGFAGNGKDIIDEVMIWVV